MNRRLRQESEQTLPESGDSADICHECGGTGYVFYTENEINYAKECECRERIIMSRRLKFAELPETFRETEISSFDLNIYRKAESINRIAVAARTISYYLDNFEHMQSRGMGLYLYSGTKGSGKTRMAAGIANELLKCHQVKFAGSTTIIKEIKHTWNRKPDDKDCTESQLLDAMALAEILIIDDFGTENPAPWINDRFYQIINDRYVNRKVTVFTSNYSLGELQYDDRIANRIKERTYQIAFPEESVRDCIAEQNMREMLKALKAQKGE